jgi:hypothetical protein
VEKDVFERGDPPMTTDRDRVGAPQDDTVSLDYADMDRLARSAKDALAPPPAPLGREAVTMAVRAAMQRLGCLTEVCPDQTEFCMCKRIADAVLALLPAAPPPGPFNEAALTRKVKELEDGLRFYQGKGGPTPTDASDREIERLKADVLKLDRMQNARTRYWQNTERERARLEADVERLTSERDEARAAVLVERQAKHDAAAYWRERAEAAEKERDKCEALATQNYHERQAAEARLARAREALEHLDRARRVSERDQRPVPHWVIVEACGVLRAIADSEPQP